MKNYKTALQIVVQIHLTTAMFYRRTAPPKPGEVHGGLVHAFGAFFGYMQHRRHEKRKDGSLQLHNHWVIPAKNSGGLREGVNARTKTKSISFAKP